MPIVHIHVVRGRPLPERRAIIEGIHSALVECFKIPDSDRSLILHEHEPESFESARGREFTLVEITAFPGRSAQAKRALFAAIVKNLERAPGIPPAKLTIIVHEPPLSNWGVRGGKPANEVELGFKLDV